MLLSQPMIQPTLALAAKADVTFVGIGDLGPKAPLYVDGFITEAELKALQKAGAVGEICRLGVRPRRPLIDGITNDRVAVGAAAVARELAGDRARHGRTQAAGHPRGGDASAGQRPDHRRAHRGRAAGERLTRALIERSASKCVPCPTGRCRRESPCRAGDGRTGALTSSTSRRPLAERRAMPAPAAKSSGGSGASQSAFPWRPVSLVRLPSFDGLIVDLNMLAEQPCFPIERRLASIKQAYVSWRLQLPPLAAIRAFEAAARHLPASPRPPKNSA